MNGRHRWQLDLVVDDELLTVFTCSSGEPTETSLDTIKALARWTSPANQPSADEDVD